MFYYGYHRESLGQEELQTLFGEFVSWKSSQLKQQCPLTHPTTSNQGGEGMLKGRRHVQPQHRDKRALSRWDVRRERALPRRGQPAAPQSPGSRPCPCPVGRLPRVMIVLLSVTETRPGGIVLNQVVSSSPARR